MKVQARGINVKGHTTNWKVGGKWVTRSNAVKLARQGKIENVGVREGGNDGAYIYALPGNSPLGYLPERLNPIKR